MGESRRILVAMSGGVDSSTVAWLLKEAGNDVAGAFMSRSDESSAQACARAARVAEFLEIPFSVVDCDSEFETLIDLFCSEYLRGRTPNPCAVCNPTIKFKRLLGEAERLGMDALATGHYVRSSLEGGRWRLWRGVDERKDQSYYLFGLTQKHLQKVIFPLGDRTKEEVRQLAARAGLPSAESRESQDVCFVPDGDYARLVRERFASSIEPGDIVDTSGSIVGRHDGIAGFTIGQRRGVGVAAGVPRYVISIDPRTSRIVIGTKKDLEVDHCTVENVNWVSIPAPAQPIECGVQIRYQSKPTPATVTIAGRYTIYVRFEHPQRAVTPGQAAVFYDGLTVLGGGWIAGD